jgi:hypothetical protein
MAEPTQEQLLAQLKQSPPHYPPPPIVYDQPLARIAEALERIADAQERANPPLTDYDKALAAKQTHRSRQRPE